MSKPATLCKLTKGKALGAFSGFVDTFNYLVDFIENLKGDGDTDEDKLITVDRTVEDRPVIKFKNSKTLEVITGLAFVIENGYLQAKLTKAKLSGVSYEDVEYDSSKHLIKIAGALTGNKIVSDTKYNSDERYTFDQDVFTETMILYPHTAATMPTKETENVFTTTYHE